MTKKRIATLATCLTLVGAVAVGGTLALISSQSKQLTNTFTVGDGYTEGDKDTADFLLQENGVTQQGNGNYTNNETVVYGVNDGAVGVPYENVVANSDLAKNPWFTLKDQTIGEQDNGKTPPNSWIVAKVDNIAAFEAAGLDITAVAQNTKWKLVTATKDAEGTWSYKLDTDSLVDTDFKSDGENTKYYFVYTEQLVASDEEKQNTQPLFTMLHAGEINEESLNTNIVVKGVAVQAATSESTLNDQATLDDVMAAASDKLG